MKSYKIKFDDASEAGFPAKDLEEAHSIAVDYAEESYYKLYLKELDGRSPAGYFWRFVGDNNA